MDRRFFLAHKERCFFEVSGPRLILHRAKSMVMCTHVRYGESCWACSLATGLLRRRRVCSRRIVWVAWSASPGVDGAVGFPFLGKLTSFAFPFSSIFRSERTIPIVGIEDETYLEDQKYGVLTFWRWYSGKVERRRKPWEAEAMMGMRINSDSPRRWWNGSGLRRKATSSNNSSKVRHKERRFQTSRRWWDGSRLQRKATSGNIGSKGRHEKCLFQATTMLALKFEYSPPWNAPKFYKKNQLSLNAFLFLMKKCTQHPSPPGVYCCFPILFCTSLCSFSLIHLQPISGLVSVFLSTHYPVV